MQKYTVIPKSLRHAEVKAQEKVIFYPYLTQDTCDPDLGAHPVERKCKVISKSFKASKSYSLDMLYFTHVTLDPEV